MRLIGFVYKLLSGWIGSVIVVLFIIFFVVQGFIIPTRSMVGTFYEGDMLIVKKFSYGIPIPKIPWMEIPIFPDFNSNGHLIEGKRPARGDVVVFNPPRDDKLYFIKRTFGVGGDQIIFASDGMYLRPKEGDAYIKEHFSEYETKEFFGEMYVREPYSLEHPGIHYGGDRKILSSLYQMKLLNDNISPKRDNDSDSTSVRGVAPYTIAMDLREDYNHGEVFYAKVPEDSFFMVGDNRDNSDDSRFWGTVDYSRIVGRPWFIYFSLTLENSSEAGVSDKKNLYKVRWERMFRNMESLERGSMLHGYKTIPSSASDYCGLTISPYSLSGLLECFNK